MTYDPFEATAQTITAVTSPFAQAMREQRKRLGLTQQQAAQITGMSRAQIANLESGASFPSMATFVRLCNAYEVTPNELLGWHDRE